MKKIYQQPTLKVFHIETQSIMASSTLNGTTDMGNARNRRSLDDGAMAPEGYSENQFVKSEGTWTEW